MIHITECRMGLHAKSFTMYLSLKEKNSERPYYHSWACNPGDQGGIAQAGLNQRTTHTRHPWTHKLAKGSSSHTQGPLARGIRDRIHETSYTTYTMESMPL